jgi:hypothetical protein
VTPYRQLFEHNPPHSYGDCFRTALGCLLDLPPEQVPHFAQDTGECDRDVTDDRANEWLAKRGLFLFELHFTYELPDLLEWMQRLHPDVYYLMTGKSKRDFCHISVYCGDQLACDPHGDDGIVGPIDGVLSVGVLVPLLHMRGQP